MFTAQLTLNRTIMATALSPAVVYIYYRNIKVLSLKFVANTQFDTVVLLFAVSASLLLLQTSAWHSMNRETKMKINLVLFYRKLF